ncbi:Doxorubicin resistance ATP-binding protein DrrA [Streptomyces sp. AVP053U2]|nr:Doxorubicin resistance ATP-binding protein DrrA [Streptomyces sp. AVP053U2]
MKFLFTLVTADADELRVGGHDPAADPQAVRAAIGVTGRFSAVDGLITGEENTLLMADLHHLPRSEGRRTAAELLERFDLVEAATSVAPVGGPTPSARKALARHAATTTVEGNPRRHGHRLPRNLVRIRRSGG